MTKFIRFWLVVIFLITAEPHSEAQQQVKSPARFGWLWYGSAPATLPTIETAIVDGLRELGYVEGKTFVFEHRFAEGRPERLPDLAAALAQQKS